MSLRKLLLSLSLFLAVSLPFAGRCSAQAAEGATVHGTVVDPDQALIPGATITISSASGKAQTTTAKDDGTYTFHGLAAGTYTIKAAAPGFADYSSQPVTVAAGANVPADVRMELATTAQTVNVTTSAVQLSVDPENNASATVIQGDALTALSDDPDELQSELQALAGPSAGPNGGQIYIDGFTGGQLPPKSSILAIRINSNPFSAQYDELGYGRIEILTKPGTDKMHGMVSFNGNDKFLNTSSPFVKDQPDYHTLFGFGNVTGPIRTGMSYSIGGSYRDIANNSIINPPDIYSASPTATTVCQPGDTSCSSNPFPINLRGAPSPQTRWDINPRFDTMLGSKNTLTVRFESEHGSSSSHGGGNSLPTLGSSTTSGDETIQVSDTQVWTDKIINETRGEWERETSNVTPLDTSTGANVTGYFSAFGSGGTASKTVTSHYELQNYTSIQLAKNFVRLGGRLRTNSETNTSIINPGGTTNGSLTYSYLLDPCTDSTITNKPSGCANINEGGVACSAGPAALIQYQLSSYQCAVPFIFSQTTIYHPVISANQWDAEFYAEDDWKVTPNLTWSYGLRLETQNFINSTHDLGPRTSLAWGVPRKSGKTTTVLRFGAGIFFDRYSLGSILNLKRGDPANQTTVSYQNPGTACTPTSTTPCTQGTGPSSARFNVPVASPTIRSPYTLEFAATLEQQLTSWMNVSVTYLNARGFHQELTRTFPYSSAPCAYTGSAIIPPSSTSYIQCDQSEGIYRQNQINTSINVRTPKGTSIFGYYSANWANSNLSGITNPYNSKTDYGRAAFAVRSRMTLGGTIPLPWLITASPMIIAQSGNPYNITTGVDNNDDGVYDDRPGWGGMGMQKPTPAFCRNANSFNVEGAPSNTPIQGENYQEIPVNYCTGPANVTFNLRLSRTFGFGKRAEPTPGRGGPGGPGGPGGFGGGFGGGPGGGGRGGRGGGFGGGGFGGGRGTNSGHKYNLTIGAQAQNLFNEVPYGTPVSQLNNSRFGQQITLGSNSGFGRAGGGSSAVRQITLQANFSF